ncbi:MAG: S8 family serine peptidase, partial [Pseudomonadota bacterium]|nr:S8 family serine peptidase [Pseudomonadota bacterium]
QTGAGAGAPCTLSGCNHGTHVASIAAGRGDSFSGIARDASLIAIQVFSRLDNPDVCGNPPCLVAFDSDIIRGLERVLELGATLTVAAANMSLGGSAYTSEAQCDADNVVFKMTVDELRAARIATVAASGNGRQYNAISTPGCISTVISVGSTTETDTVSSFSNSASFLDLLAPGSSITSARPGGTFQTLGGTSMATPHVAGAFAILCQAYPSASVAELLALLKETGTPVTDQRNRRVTPRLQIDAALDRDGDGLPSPWEQANGLDPADPGDALLDGDADGLDNLGEYLADTDPNDPDSDGDGAPDGADSRPLNAAYRGSESGAASANHLWTPVSLPSRFANPVVILGVPTVNGGQQGVARLRGVGPDGFETRFQEYAYLDGNHAFETIPHLVVEQGRRTLADGSVWEAGRISVSGSGQWQAVSFPSALPGAPLLLLTVQTANGPEAVVARARNVTAAGFEVALFEEEALQDGHVAETVGYLAIHSPAGSGRISIGGRNRAYLLQRQEMDHRFVPVLGGALKLEEERSADDEVVHPQEAVDLLALDGEIYAQTVTSRDADTVALRRIAPDHAAPLEWGTVTGVGSGWVTIPLSRRYANPVVVAQAGQQADAEPGVVRLRNAAADAFQARFAEWDYLDGVHPGERIFYLVAEAGSFDIAGLPVEAGTVTTDHVLGDGWVWVGLSRGFAAPPGLFTSVMTAADSATVTTRVRDLGATGFHLAMQEQEANSDGHAAETLGWIAIGAGSGATETHRRLEVARLQAGHQPVAFTFAQPSARLFPVLLGNLSSTDGANPATAAQAGLNRLRVQLYVQEENSVDAENSHVPEILSVLVAD